MHAFLRGRRLFLAGIYDRSLLPRLIISQDKSSRNIARAKSTTRFARKPRVFSPLHIRYPLGRIFRNEFLFNLTAEEPHSHEHPTSARINQLIIIARVRLTRYRRIDSAASPARGDRCRQHDRRLWQRNIYALFPPAVVRMSEKIRSKRDAMKDPSFGSTTSER